MRVALTGGSGFVGSHVLAELVSNGHDVTALVRDRGNADAVAARGARPVIVDFDDRSALASQFAAADAGVHTASPGDETSAAFDSAVVDAAIDAFAGTGKAHVQISGVWVYGNNTAITEASSFNAPALVAWREAIEGRILERDDMRGAVIVSGVAYGDGGGGVPGVLLGSPRDEAGRLIMLGTGDQHWATVHAADLAGVFRRILESDSARGYFVVGNGVDETVAGLTRAAAAAVGAPGAVPGSDEEARGRLGDYFAEVLLLDQAVTADRARAELGWAPAQLSLTQELEQGSYRR